MKELQINLSHEQLKKISKQKLSKIVKKQVKQKAFEDLSEVKDTHKKTKNLKYDKLQIQPYLRYLTLDDAKMAFKIRSNMIDVKSNFSSQHRQNMNCRLCLIEIDDQSHLLTCEYLKIDDEVTSLPEYSNINGSNVHDISEIVKVLKNKIRTRERILNEILDI